MEGSYEKLLKVIRSESEKKRVPTLRLGRMKTEKICTVSQLDLDMDDLYIAEHLVTGYHKAVDRDDPEKKNNDTFVTALKAGDIVLVYPLSEEKYVIIDRLVT